MEDDSVAAHGSSVRLLLSRYLLTDGLDLVADLRKSRGCHIYDAGRQEYFLDFHACFATIPLGYNHPRLTSPEVREELAWTAVQKPSNSDLYTAEFADFVERFTRIGMPEPMKYMFFIEGGALAVENALKTAFDWKARKNLAAGKQPRASQVIHFREAFHGRSGYTLSLTNTHDIRKTQYFPIFDWPRIDNPKCRYPLRGDNLRQVMAAEQLALKQIEASLAKQADDIACLILEPIQSEGGDNHFRLEFHQALRRLCDEHDILLIYDEIQTGFGASGRMWCCEHFVSPDIICFGKKSQVCGILVSEKIDEVAENVFKVPSRINSTWGGNLVDMLRSRIYLEVYRDEDLVARATRMGDRLLRRLRALEQEFPRLVSNTRGLGLLCAFDLPDPDQQDTLVRDLFTRKLLILPCGRQSIRFRTPLTISRDDLDKGLRIIRDALQAFS